MINKLISKVEHSLTAFRAYFKYGVTDYRVTVFYFDDGIDFQIEQDTTIDYEPGDERVWTMLENGFTVRKEMRCTNIMNEFISREGKKWRKGQ